MGKPAFRHPWGAAAAFSATFLVCAAEASGRAPPGAASAGAASAAAALIEAPERANGEVLEPVILPDEAQEPQAAALWHQPRIAVGADLGVGHYWNGRAARDWGFGAAWQLGAGVQWNGIVATEIRYFGVDNTRDEFDLLTTGVSMDVRLSVPLAVRPFLAMGFGWYTTLLFDGGRLVVSPPIALQVPVSAGVEAPLGSGMSVQLAFAHRFLAEGGTVDAYPATMQLWSATAGARAYF